MRTHLLITLLLLSKPCLSAAQPPPTFGLDLLLDASAGLQGGVERGTATNGLATFNGDWSDRDGDADTRFTTIHASVMQIFGHGPTERYVGDLLTVSNAEAHPSLRLYATWIELQRQDVSVRAGLLLADEEFGFSDAGSHLINASFGWPIYLSANTRNTGPAFFAAGAGARLRFAPSATSYFQVGIYDGDTFDSPTGDPTVNHNGLHYRFGDGQGVFAMAEYGWSAPTGVRLKAGTWLHTARFEDMYSDELGGSHAVSGHAPESHRGNGGAYVVLERTLRGEAGQPGSVDAYIRGGLAPADRNLIGWAYDAGLAWYPGWAGRAQDVLAVGFTHARFSSDFTRTAAIADPAASAPEYEQVLEISYRLALTDAIGLQPDLQYIRNPGGGNDLDDAVIVMVRIAASF